MMSHENEVSKDYIKRINKALFFIEENLLSELSLAAVAEQAHYSPFHFHRIFKAITNETLNAYIHRKRIEKAAVMLFHKQGEPISKIYLACGFSSNSSFTRAFKNTYGLSPTKFRKTNPGKYSRISQNQSKNGQADSIFEEYICNIENHLNWIDMNAEIAIKTLQKLDLAYITQIGEKGLSKAFTKLMNWAGPKGLLNDPELKMATLYHDSFKVTATGRVRMSACIILKNPIQPEGVVGVTTIEKGKFIVARFEIGIQEFENAWTSLFIWMNENGYKKADRSPFEIYHNNFNDHPDKMAIVDFHIPVE